MVLGYPTAKINAVNMISILLHLGIWHVVSSLFQVILSDLVL
jgi:hypothetical protein